MGKLLEAIHAVPPSGAVSGQRCKVGIYLDSLPPEDGDDLQTALSTKVNDKFLLSGVRLANVLAPLGIDLSPSIIKEHRARLCRCYRVVTTNG